MEKTIDKIANANARDDIIELGVASVETKGDAGMTEGVGILAAPGISDQ